MVTAPVDAQAQQNCDTLSDFAEECRRQSLLVAQADSTDAAMHQFMDEALADVDTSLDEGYQAMAADMAREAEAVAWCNALAEDIADAAR